MFCMNRMSQNALPMTMEMIGGVTDFSFANAPSLRIRRQVNPVNFVKGRVRLVFVLCFYLPYILL